MNHAQLQFVSNQQLLYLQDHTVFRFVDNNFVLQAGELSSVPVISETGRLKLIFRGEQILRGRGGVEIDKSLFWMDRILLFSRRGSQNALKIVFTIFIFIFRQGASPTWAPPSPPPSLFWLRSSPAGYLSEFFSF